MDLQNCLVRAIRLEVCGRVEADEITKKMVIFGIIWMTVKYGTYAVASDLTLAPSVKLTEQAWLAGKEIRLLVHHLRLGGVP